MRDFARFRSRRGFRTHERQRMRRRVPHGGRLCPRVRSDRRKTLGRRRAESALPFFPLEYYASYYSIRADNFSYELMCFGKDKLDYYINDYKKRADAKQLSPKEEGQLKDMRIVQEMYARGFEFMPIDLYKSHSRNFQIVDGKLLPPFKSIDGLGEAASDGIYEAAKNGAFLSKEDFISRSKVSKTSAALMADLGILSGLPESNQLSLFDMF